MPWYCLALSWGLTLPSCPGFGFLIRNLSIVYFPPLSSKHGNQLTVKESCLSSWDIYCHQSPNWFRASWSANDCQRYKTSNQDKLSWRPPWRIWKWVDGKALALFLKLFLVFSRQNMRIYAQKSYCMIRTAIALAHFSQGPDSLMLES